MKLSLPRFAAVIPLLLFLAGCADTISPERVRHERGRLMLVRNRPSEAIAIFRELRSERPEDATVHYDLGRSYARAGDLEQALGSYSAAVQFDRGSVQPRINLSEILSRLGRFAEALQEADAAIAIDATSPLAWQTRALAHRGLKQVDRADADLKVSMALAPRDLRNRWIAAMLLLDRGRQAQAIAALNALLKQMDAEDAAFQHQSDVWERTRLRAEILDGVSQARKT